MSSKGTDLQSFRIDLDLWKRFAEAAKARGSDRSKVLRDFIREYVGEAAVETEPHQRQVESTRRVLAMHYPRERPGETLCGECREEWPCNAVKLLTLPAADRREE